MAGSALGGAGIGGTPAGQPHRGQGGFGGAPAGGGQVGIGGTLAGGGKGGIGGTPAGQPHRGQGGIGGTLAGQPYSGQGGIGGTPAGQPHRGQGGIGGTLAGQPHRGQAGIGGTLAGGGQGGIGGTPAGQPHRGQGGIGGGRPAGSQPQQGQYAPLAPQGNFDVNQAAAGGLQQAMQGTQQAMNFQPQQIGAAGYNPAQIAGQDLSAYTNPYESQVVDAALGDLERSRQMQQNQLGAQATASRAFGGSRQGIAESETNRAFSEQAANTAAQLRQAGFANAQGLAGQDVGSMNQALQFGAGAQNAAMSANQQAGLQGNQQLLAASNQMGTLGQQAFNTGQTIQQNQMTQGLMQQGLQQALIDAASGQYAGYVGSPGASLNAPLAALGVAGPNSGSTTTGTSSPGLFDYLGLGFGAYAASDQRLKTNIKPRGEVGGVKLYNWEWNDEGKRVADPAQPTFGVMADELQETHPHLVKRGEDGYLRVNYHGLVAELEAA